jgi:hypothetical protein
MLMLSDVMLIVVKEGTEVIKSAHDTQHYKNQLNNIQHEHNSMLNIEI